MHLLIWDRRPQGTGAARHSSWYHQSMQLQPSTLLACPGEGEIRDYYDEVFRKGGKELADTIEVRVKRGEEGGKSHWLLEKSVHAKRPLKEGEIVFIEDPLVSMQHVENAEGIHCCDGCLRFADADGPVCCRVGRVVTRFCEDCRMSTAALVHRRYMCGACNEKGALAALEVFYELAADTNDIFILAAKLLANVMHRAKATKTLEEAWQPYAMGYKMLWWESVARPEDVPEDEEVAFRADLRELASDAFDAFCVAVQESSPEDYERYRGNLLSLDVWGSVIGMFELNNLSILARGPVGKDEGDQEDDRDECGNDELSEDRYYEDLVEGSGFYRLHSCFNHSCDPNCRVLVPRDDTENSKAIVETLRDIERGEELTFSYLEDETEPYQVRQDQLRDYGFECRCAKCLLELEFCV